MIDDRGISCTIALKWMALGLTDDKTTLVQLISWCRQATSHYLSRFWPIPVHFFTHTCVFLYRRMSSLGHNGLTGIPKASLQGALWGARREYWAQSDNEYQGATALLPGWTNTALTIEQRLNIQYISRNMHTVLLCFALLWLCNRS